MTDVILIELERQDLDEDDRLRIARDTRERLGVNGQINVCSRELAIQKLGEMDP